MLGGVRRFLHRRRCAAARYGAPGWFSWAPPVYSQPLICRAISQNPDRNAVNDIGAYAFSLGHVQTRRSVGALA